MDRRLLPRKHNRETTGKQPMRVTMGLPYADWRESGLAAAQAQAKSFDGLKAIPSAFSGFKTSWAR